MKLLPKRCWPSQLRVRYEINEAITHTGESRFKSLIMLDSHERYLYALKIKTDGKTENKNGRQNGK